MAMAKSPEGISCLHIAYRMSRLNTLDSNGALAVQLVRIHAAAERECEVESRVGADGVISQGGVG